jgi:hypothetical protein
MSPFTRRETIEVLVTKRARPAFSPQPTIRQRTLDWHALTRVEQDAVSAYQCGDATIESVPERGRVYLRRHGERES